MNKIITGHKLIIHHYIIVMSYLLQGLPGFLNLFSDAEDAG